MTDEQAFLAAIVAAPDDDGLRLAYADWLEGRGDPDDLNYAHFIRCQCAGVAYRGRRKGRFDHGRIARRALGPTLCKLLEYEDMIGRVVRQLVVSGKRGPRWMVRSLHDNEYARQDENFNYGDPLPRPRVYISRGFVDSVTLSAAAWLSNADAIVAAAPVRGIALMTRMRWLLLPAGAALFADGEPTRLLRCKPPGGALLMPSDDYLRILLAAEWPRVKVWTLPDTLGPRGPQGPTGVSDSMTFDWDAPTGPTPDTPQVQGPPGTSGGPGVSFAAGDFGE